MGLFTPRGNDRFLGGRDTRQGMRGSSSDWGGGEKLRRERARAEAEDKRRRAAKRKGK